LKGGAVAKSLSTDHNVRGGAAAAQVVACAAGPAVGTGPGADAAQVALDAAQVALDAAQVALDAAQVALDAAEAIAAQCESLSMAQVAAQAATCWTSAVQPGSAMQARAAAAAPVWVC